MSAIFQTKSETVNTNQNQNDFFGKSAAKPFFSPTTIQPKLTIGAPNDKYEQEADAMADRVVAGETARSTATDSTSTIHRMCADCEQEESVQRMPEEEESVQRMTEDEEVQPKLMRKSKDGGGVATPAFSSQLNGSKGGGQALPDSVNRSMSSAFGHDFSSVRIHNDSRSSDMNSGINARAFTHGSDVYFNRGAYNPGSTEGKRLLAHELTHVVQQGGGKKNNIQRLSIKQNSLVSGKCGARRVRWTFSLGKAAAQDGYIVQQVDTHEFTAKCPNKAVGPPAPGKPFWEAWFVKKGDKNEHQHSKFGYTDQSARPSRPGYNGTQISAGKVKFFHKSVTGDLGKDGVPSSDKKSKWGPGKVPLSGSLPSTPNKPSWWDTAPTEGPVNREASSTWDCCDKDPSKHVSIIKAKP